MHHLGNVRPGGESFVPRPGEDDRLDGIHPLYPAKDGNELAVDLAVQGVKALGPVQGDQGQWGLQLQCDNFFHGISSYLLPHWGCYPR